MDATAKDDVLHLARAEEALARLARQAARDARLSRGGPSDIAAVAATPDVDPTAPQIILTGEPIAAIRKPPSSSRTPRTLFCLLLAGALAAALLGWQWYGDISQELFARLRSGASSEQPVPTPPISPAIAQQENAPADAKVETTPQAAALDAQMPTPAIALPNELMEQLKAMAQDVASLRQRVDQLTASQEQMGRTIGKLQAVERNVRTRRVESQSVPPVNNPVSPLPPPPPPSQALPASPQGPEDVPGPPRPPAPLR